MYSFLIHVGLHTLECTYIYLISREIFERRIFLVMMFVAIDNGVPYGQFENAQDHAKSRRKLARTYVTWTKTEKRFHELLRRSKSTERTTFYGQYS